MALHVNSQMIVWNGCVHGGSTFEPNLHCHSSKSLEYVCVFHENELEVLSSIATERL